MAADPAPDRLWRVGFSWISGLDALLGGGCELNPLLEGEVSLLLRSKSHKTGILWRASCSGLGFPSAQGIQMLGPDSALLPDVAGTPQYQGSPPFFGCLFQGKSLSFMPHPPYPSQVRMGSRGRMGTDGGADFLA